METNYKITIPKPCHEDWNQMTPDETGRFCNSCVKSVVDFTNMKAPEIQDYFIKNQGQSVCGRFKNEQINKFDIQIPQSVLNRKMSFHKAFILALFIAMGSTLFSCKNNDASLGEVTVVQDTIKQQPQDTIKEGRLVGDIVCTTETPKTEKVKDKVDISKTNIVTSGIVEIEPYGKNNDTPIKRGFYLSAELEKLASFPGGIKKFYEYFNSNFDISYDKEDIARPFLVSFIINTDGSLSDIKFLRGINEEMNNEASRVLKLSPKWIPGEVDGKKVKAFYSIPIKITPQ